MKQVEQHQKLVRFSAIFFALILVAVLCLPMTTRADVKRFNASESSSTPSSTPSSDRVTNNDDDDEPSVNPMLYVKSAEKLILSAGDVVDFPMIVSSRTNDYTEDVRISISGQGDYASKFSVQDPTGWYKVENLVIDQRIVPTLNVSSDLPDGRYQLNVSFQYVDYKGNSYSSTDVIYVTVYGKSSDKPYIASAKFQGGEIGKENKAKLDLGIYNPTKSTVQYVKVAFDTAKNEKMSLYENFQPVEIFGINPEATGIATFSVYLGSGVATGNYPLTFTVSYRTSSGDVYTSTQTVYAEVKRSSEVEDDGKNATKPRIIIQSYKTSVEVIEAGKTFDLDFTLQNTSADTAVTNVKVVLGSEEASTNTTTGTKSTNNVFFPSEGSNSFFMESIAPKGSVTRSISLTTSQDVEPGVYSLTLDIQYDASGSAATPATEKLSFPITQQQRLDIQGFSVQDSGMAMTGSPVPVTFQYINKGKATIYNFSVDVEGDFTLQDTTNAYIGNLTSGYNDTYENALLPAKEGECKGAILLKYEDSQGAEKVERKEFTLNVQAGDMGMVGGGMDIGGMMPMEPEEVPQEGISPIILWIAGGVVVVGGGLTTYLILRRRKKKAWEDASDDEEN